MAENLTRKLIRKHLVEGKMKPGEELAIQIHQTLTQDATGTLVMLAFESMGIARVETDVSVQYVDHNLIQEDFKNPDDHVFLRSAAQKYGLWFSPAGNGVSHPLHQERFGKPGATLMGSDSHTPAAGALGMFAVGAGGLEVALAMAGKPAYLRMPKVIGIRLEGELPDWVSAKDVVLEMLRRHGVKGAKGGVIEYYGPGLDALSAMDRHVIANMGTELGATTTVFPSDEAVRRFLRRQQREEHWQEWQADVGCSYDMTDVIDLSTLEPLIALPSSPDNVVPVSKVAGEPLYQAYLGSSANPGLRDFVVPALMLEGKHIDHSVSLDVNPTTRSILHMLTEAGCLGKFIASGARIHQAGCNGCIGMGQAPATNGNSLRTVPRNFPGRSGTREDRVFLCSPETATASALTGKITDPRTLQMDCPRFDEPECYTVDEGAFIRPTESPATIELSKGPNIVTLPELDPLADSLAAPVALKVGDNVSTDEILPAGSRVLPYRSNLPEISAFCFDGVEQEFAKRIQGKGMFFVVGGYNYGQGSSREHAALAPRYLGMRIVIAKSFARIHWQNLVNFGVLPLTFANADDYDNITQHDVLQIENWRECLRTSRPLALTNKTRHTVVNVESQLSPRQIESILAGGRINQIKSSV